MSTEEMLEKARNLPPEAQADLIEALMNQLDHAGRDIEAEWTAEAQSRLIAYRQGKLKAIPLEQVLAKYRVR